MDQYSGTSRRRFERIQLNESVPESSAMFLGVEALWEDTSRSSVFDMSYTGMALAPPSTFTAQKGEKLKLRLKLGDHPPVDLEVEVMWVKKDVMGVSFHAISSEGRLLFNHFLDDKLLGAELHLVSPKLYGSDMDCTYWFQGIGDTNVYVWTEKATGASEVIKELRVELDDYYLVYRNGVVAEVGGGVSEGGFHAKYGEITAEVDVKELAAREKEFVGRVVSLLSQMGSLTESLNPVLDKLSQLEM
ncbi:MAG: PilZ domain-containing protein [Bdellovibrionales bacterium]|nr:PilZ domain-containing protein [Bdellovibrionales bacterium]